MVRAGKERAKRQGILRAEVSDVRQIATLLKTVNIHGETKATVIVQDDGLSFNVEVGHTVLARAHFHHKNNFLSYSYHPPEEAWAEHRRNRRRGSAASDEEEEGEGSRERDGSRIRNESEEGEEGEDEESPKMLFEISLSAFLNCLNIFGDATVRPVSAAQLAAREKWKQRQAERGGRDWNDGNDDEDAHGEDNDSYMRPYQRAGSTTSAINATTGSSRKKARTAMIMSWEAEGCPLVLLLEENDIVTRCELTTFEAGEVFDLPYDDAERMQKLILQPSWLSEALSEIDPSCERLTLRFSPPNACNGQGRDDDEEGDERDEETSFINGAATERTSSSSIRYPPTRAAFMLEGVSNSGSVQMEYPFTREVLEVCECEKAIRNTYRFSHLSYIRTALSYSTKASLRTDSSGILIMQFMIPNVSGSEDEGYGFVEFTCMPLEEQD